MIVLGISLNIMKPFAIAICLSAYAAASVRFLSETKTFLIDTAHSSYVFGVNENAPTFGGELRRIPQEVPEGLL